MDFFVKLVDNVMVGSWSYIGLNVEIGEGIEVMFYVVIKGLMRIGCNNCIFQFFSVGEEC